MRRALALLILAGLGCQQKARQPFASTNDDEKRNSIVAPAAVATIAGLAGPESALYDPDQDVYFISNINGGLLERDNNGFISRVNAQTLTIELKWIEGGRNNLTLDAPKGMAIVGESLYVADVLAVRKFDRRTGAVQGEIPLPGATCINDLTTDGSKIYVSDTAVVPAEGLQLARTGTDAVWVIENDRARKIASGAALNQPNGVAFVNGKLWVVTFGANELFELDGDRKKSVITLPRPQLDGVVALPDGTFFVTSWDGMAVYRGSATSPFEPILQGVPTPADIGYDTKRHRLLLPASSLNHVTVHDVSR